VTLVPKTGLLPFLHRFPYYTTRNASWYQTSTTDDGSTHPLAERLKPGPFRTQKEVAVLGILTERMGTNEVS